MGVMSKLRVAFVNTHPIQYFAPLYAYLNQTGVFAVTALYLSDFSVRGSLDAAFGQVVKWDVDLLSGYDVRFVEGAGIRNEPAGVFSIIAPQIWREVSRGGFDALVVHGHTPAAALIAVAAALVLHSKDRQARIGGILVLLIIGPSMLLTFSRGGYLAMAGVAVALALSHRYRVWLLAGTAGVVIGLTLIPPIYTRLSVEF